MDVEKHVEFWRNGAREDWEVGAGLVRDGRTRHGLFFVHLAIEKALKALVCRKTAEVPPRIHNLVKLAELAGLQPDRCQLDLLGEMNEFNMAGRYPDFLPAPPSREEASAVVARAGEVFTWLMQA